MRRHHLSFAVCLALSLLVHGALLWTAHRWAVGPVHVAKVAQLPDVLRVPDASLLPVPPPSLGEKNGTGDAINGSPGDVLQTAPKAMHDQASSTRDPTGSRSGAPPAPSPQPLSEAVTAPPPKPLPTPPPSPAIAPRMAEKPTPPDASPQQPDRPQQPRPENQRPPSAPGGGRPIPHSDRDSDLFAKTAGLDYRAGRVVAQGGRDFKFTRPDQDLAALVDAAMLTTPIHLTLRINVDDKGHPRLVTVETSSGSSSIDRAFELAAYASWFAPGEDANGQPAADSFAFPISVD